MEVRHETDVQQPVAPTHTTVIHEKRGSGGIIIGLVVLVGIVIAALVFMRQQDSQVMRDTAVADAAQKVGESAEQAGQAIEDAASQVAPQ